MNGEGKRVLVLGGTGVMGSFLVKELLNMGYCVDAGCSKRRESENAKLSYFGGDFTDFHTIRSFLAGRHYDAIVDFMTYNTAKFAERFELLFSSADHFIFLSSYRAYSDVEIPTRESSPKLLNVTDDIEFLQSDDYSLFKTREENIIRNSRFRNWTIVRPAITYSSRRIAFVTLELPLMIRRAKAGKPIYIPEEVVNVEATCTYAGDVAAMIARLILNPAAYCEDYSVCTAEHRTWGTIAGYYKELLGADIRTVPLSVYKTFFDYTASKGMLEYDR